MRAAIGLAQLNKLESNNQKRHTAKQIYDNLLADIDEISVPFSHHQGVSSYHILPIILHRSHRPRFMEFMKGKRHSNEHSLSAHPPFFGLSTGWTNPSPTRLGGYRPTSGDPAFIPNNDTRTDCVYGGCHQSMAGRRKDRSLKQNKAGIFMHMSHADVIHDDLNYMCQHLDEEFRQLSGHHLLMTGGAGFLGYYMIQSLLHWNHTRNDMLPIYVTVYDNYIRGIPEWAVCFVGRPAPQPDKTRYHRSPAHRYRRL